uniref:Large ribosomal subunit protein uL22c n=1 Tax=Phlegmariurus carinatus TaxID=380491 RepID=A0A7G7XPR4_PHLCA|nr:ribosomal protein L22 [Phlegmariurus carinatus]QNH82404.1 ribosomal protein L22 [Phlegmariurus carinatus]WBV80252.1 ribosomal protein L22 [Phlegmariurus squarrosus]
MQKMIKNLVVKEFFIMKIGNESKKEEIKFIYQNINMSTYKLRRVANQIRGQSFEEAVLILEFLPYRACYPLLKLISNAVEKVSDSMGLRKADLIVSKVIVNAGSFKKRLQPRARGRSYPIEKPTSHLTIMLKEKYVYKKEEEENGTKD